MNHDRLGFLRCMEMVGALSADEAKELRVLERQRAVWEAEQQGRLRFSATGEIVVHS